MLPDIVAEEIIDHVRKVGTCRIEALADRCKADEFAPALAPEIRLGVEQEVCPAEETALDIDLRGPDFRLSLETVIDDDLGSVLDDRSRCICRCCCCILGDRDGVSSTVDIDIDAA
ncbi:hypothetical protein D3C80_844030 [compost metagenome]